MNPAAAVVHFCITPRKIRFILGSLQILNYSNPHMSPFEEFQRWKHHPETLKYLQGAVTDSLMALELLLRVVLIHCPK